MAVHFIGQLQTNKVRQIADLVDVYETVDRPALVAELAKRAPGAAFWCRSTPRASPARAVARSPTSRRWSPSAVAAGLESSGLMTVGPTEGGPEAARPGFRAVRRLVDRLGLPTCSMGMSDDLDVAVEEGSTEVRVGTALFGARPR